ncbi:hypothetical protein BJ508DRAFT_41326 [Ascobolus immersus RN42]|uniref:Uncharacterized protein n=1 Tax=Ascobolus immersus RN42 TaxID=1160509 RepID=A0A3N4HM87_ASCIM|nr:hypothetical protein BJ508DRAFT_41326 [Ascobolus immersus RN42]
MSSSRSFVGQISLFFSAFFLFGVSLLFHVSCIVWITIFLLVTAVHPFQPSATKCGALHEMFLDTFLVLLCPVVSALFSVLFRTVCELGSFSSLTSLTLALVHPSFYHHLASSYAMMPLFPVIIFLLLRILFFFLSSKLKPTKAILSTE